MYSNTHNRRKPLLPSVLFSKTTKEKDYKTKTRPLLFKCLLGWDTHKITGKSLHLWTERSTEVKQPEAPRSLSSSLVFKAQRCWPASACRSLSRTADGSKKYIINTAGLWALQRDSIVSLVCSVTNTSDPVSLSVRIPLCNSPECSGLLFIVLEERKRVEVLKSDQFQLIKVRLIVFRLCMSHSMKTFETKSLQTSRWLCFSPFLGSNSCQAKDHCSRSGLNIFFSKCATTGFSFFMRWILLTRDLHSFQQRLRRHKQKIQTGYFPKL